MAELSRSSYLEKNVGSFPETIEVAGKRYEKVDDLRYGTNPHQPAAYYRPVESAGIIGGMEILKNGKSGLSQTNLEDISGALNIVKFFPGVAACAVMKPPVQRLRAPESLCATFILKPVMRMPVPHSAVLLHSIRKWMQILPMQL